MDVAAPKGLVVWMIGCVHGGPEQRIDWIVPWPPRDHALRICVSGLPARLDRCLREVEVTHIALTVDRSRIYLQQMHESSAAVTGECLGLGGVPALLWQHFVQFAHHMAHLVKLSVPCNVAAR